MKSIGFNNFRRFEKFEPIQLGEITFFVGGNNAGKSTAVKAMMLMLDNLSHRIPYSPDHKLEMPHFRLDANRIHEVHVGTFARALHQPYPEKKEFSLTSEIGDYKITLVVTGDIGTTQANAEIAQIEVVNIPNNVTYTFDFQTNEAYVSFNTAILRKYNVRVDETMSVEDVMRRGGRFWSMIEPDDKEEKEMLALLQQAQEERATLQQQLKVPNLTPQDLASINNQIKVVSNNIDKIKDRLDPFQRDLKIEDVNYKYSIHIVHGFGFGNIASSLIMGIAENLTDMPDSLDEPEQNDSHKETYLTKTEWAYFAMLSKDARQLAMAVSRDSIEYISAHAAAQKVLFSIEDKNDYMASIMREFIQCRIERGSQYELFITKWMKEFNIGLGYDIKPIEGEAYTMTITNMNGADIPLADLGMGSIQLMLLLLRLTTIIQAKRINGGIIIIEEPEQNLHPALQSRLADLFFEVNRQYGFKFVIETHSEYLIRRTQAMIATQKVTIGGRNYELKYEDNPFRVFYFPEEGEPYDMGYQKTGGFALSFGEGFYDEAAKLDMEIIIKEQEIKDFGF